MLFQELQLQRSYVLGAMFLFSHLGAIFCLFFTPFLLLVKGIITIAVLTNLVIIIKTYALRCNREAVIGLWQHDNGEWYLQTNSRESFQVFLELPIFISNYFIMLNFVSAKENKKIIVPLAKDTFMVKDNFRKLKVLLWTMRRM